MRGKIHNILILLLLLPALCLAVPVPIDFYTDGTIQDGDIYLDVHVHDSATVNMTGGEVGREFDTYQSSAINLSNGTVSLFHIFDTSTVNISGGTVGSLNVYGSGIANLTGGQIRDHLAIWNAAKVNIYGYGFDYARAGGISESGWLSGYWTDNTPFTIYMRNLPEPFPGSHVALHIIPEPNILLLVGLGWVLMRKEKAKKKSIDNHP